MYRRSGYKRSWYGRRRGTRTYGRGYQTSNRSRMSIRVPVTETFNMAWDKPKVNIDNTSGAPTYTSSWVPNNTTMVGCICPWIGFPYDDIINAYGDANHPNINATQVRIPAGRATAVNQKLYEIYTNMYDEVKLDGMTVSLSVLTPVGTTDLPSISIATSWDRKANGREVAPLFEYKSNWPQLGWNNQSLYPIPAVGSTASHDMAISVDYPNTYEELIGGSAATESTAICNSVAKIFRSCKASDIMEKNVFHDGTLSHYAAHADCNYDAAWDSNPAAVANAFSPCFYFACKRSDVPGAAGTVVTLQAEVNYYFTFRNPKFGGTSFDPLASAALLNRAIAAGAQNVAEEQRAARIRGRDMDNPGEGEMEAAAAAAIMDVPEGEFDVVLDETTRGPTVLEDTPKMSSKKSRK